LLFRRPGRVVVINKQRNRTSECGFRACANKRRDYTRVCERECQKISWRVMNLGRRGRNGKRERASENIMEHITHHKHADPEAPACTHKAQSGVDFAWCFSLFRCQLGIMAAAGRAGGAQSKHEARAKVNMLENYLGDYAPGRRRQRRLCQRD
jgi:hypothetical protein